MVAQKSFPKRQQTKTASCYKQTTCGKKKDFSTGEAFLIKIS